MHLEAEQAARRAIRGVVIHRLRHQIPIDNVCEHITARYDMNLIPIVCFDQRLEVVAAAEIGDYLPFLRLKPGHLPAHRQKAAPALFIQLSGILVREINVSLITLQHPFADFGQSRRFGIARRCW